MPFPLKLGPGWQTSEAQQRFTWRLLQIFNAVVGNVVNLSTIKKIMMLLRTLRMFKVMRKFKVRSITCRDLGRAAA